MAAQPEWLAQVPTDRRFPDGARLLFTGCGTSFHAAHDRGRGGAGARARVAAGAGGGSARPRLARGRDPAHARGCDVPGAGRAGWSPGARTGRSPSCATRSSSARRRSRRAGATPRATPVRWPRSRRCTARTSAGFRGQSRRRSQPTLPVVGEQERFLVAGAGRALPRHTRPCSSSARARGWRRRRTRRSSSSTATSPRWTSRCARSSSRAKAWARSGRPRPQRRSRELGGEVDLLPTRHPVVDVVLFQRLTVELAERLGREPDRIRRHDPRWAAAAREAKADNAA